LAKQIKIDYPENRPDWLMTEHYKKTGSRFGCVLCEKTHRAKECPNRAKVEEEVEEKKTSYYTDYSTLYAGYDDDSCGY